MLTEWAPAEPTSFCNYDIFKKADSAMLWWNFDRAPTRRFSFLENVEKQQRLCRKICKYRLQGIKNGTLSPNSYGYSTVNDAYYCFEGPDNYHKAAQRTDDFALKKYLLALEKSYRDYNEDFVTNWHLKDASSIKPIQVCLMTNCAKLLLISNSVSYWKRYNSVYCYTMVLNMYF